jgi:uncharacterized protein GlcG (DUF336 family)
MLGGLPVTVGDDVIGGVGVSGHLAWMSHACRPASTR